MRVLLWSSFAFILALTGAVALKACVLSLPGFGVVVERCPQPAQVPGLVGDETALLERRLLSLRAMAALSPDCEEEIGPRPHELEDEPEIKKAEQVLLILDTSGSMDSNRRASIEAAISARERAMNTPGEPLEQMRAEIHALQAELATGPPNEPSRFDIAREAIRPLLSDTAHGPPVSLWRYDQCDTPAHRVFPGGGLSPDEVLNSLKTENASALGPALESIPRMLSPGAARSPERAVNVLVFADGVDGCTKDPCAIAAGLKRSLPYLYIHVVAVARDLDRLQCIARATGGTSVQSEDPDAVRRVAGSIMQQSR